MAKILLVEDDKDFSHTLDFALTAESHTVECVYNGADAREFLSQSQFDVVILDWNLPDTTGIEVLKGFRAKSGTTPVLMLTGNDRIIDKETGLDGGADGYITKPCDTREVLAHIRALLRRQVVAPTNTLRLHDLVLDPIKHRLTKAGQEVRLQPRDFALLEFFMRHPDEIFSPEALLSRVWHRDSEASSSGLRASIVRIRKAIDDSESESLIENMSRIGYRMRM